MIRCIPSRRQLRRYEKLAGWLLLMGLTGCGTETPRTVPVQGRITYGGGDWPQAGLLNFTTLQPAPGFPARPGSAPFGADGRFSTTTFRTHDGLLPGSYLVHLECWESRPTMENPVGKSYVPLKFQSGSTNGFQVVVPADSTDPLELNFDVPQH